MQRTSPDLEITGGDAHLPRVVPDGTGLSGIVITGMGLVTPVGSNAEQVVCAMKAGIRGIRPMVVDDCMPLIMGQVPRLKGEKDPPAGDRALAFAVAAAEDALTQAGLDARRLPGSLFTIVGSSKGRIGNFVPPSCIAGLHPLDLTHFPGDTLGLDLCHSLGVRASLVLNCPAACATGIVCLIRAVHALQHGEADIALAGSAESAGRALLLSAFQNMGALSSHQMQPFDVSRCGFNPGEGGAVFVLEREADARARGARIIARIAGWDQRSDAAHMTAADESGDVVAYSIRKTLQQAGWEPADVDYINAHGTATRLNDIVEGRAILQVFSAQCPPVSALKPYIGHLLGASSAVELAMAVACARAGYLPPTPGLKNPDPAIPLHFVDPVGNEGEFKHILKLSLGFGGHIGVVALELS